MLDLPESFLCLKNNDVAKNVNLKNCFDVLQKCLCFEFSQLEKESQFLRASKHHPSRKSCFIIIIENMNFNICLHHSEREPWFGTGRTTCSVAAKQGLFVWATCTSYKKRFKMFRTVLKPNYFKKQCSLSSFLLT